MAILVGFRCGLSDALLLKKAIVVSEVGTFHHKVKGNIEGLLIIVVGEVGLHSEDSLKVWVDYRVVEIHMQDYCSLQNKVY